MKRSMAACSIAVLSGLLTVGSAPTSAVALSTEGEVVNPLFHDPLFMLAVFIGFTGIGGSLILACIVLHMRNNSCKHTSCVHHPYAMRVRDIFDFSSIMTPSEFRARQAEATDAGEAETTRGQDTRTASVPSAPPAAPVSPVSVPELEWVDAEIDEIEDFAPEGSYNLAFDDFASEELGFDEMELEEPQDRPTMDFTDNMVLEVVEALRRQQMLERQAVERQQALERQQIIERQQMAEQREAKWQRIIGLQWVVERKKAVERERALERQRALEEQDAERRRIIERQAAERSLARGRTGEQAAIEWLAADRVPHDRVPHDGRMPQSVQMSQSAWTAQKAHTSQGAQNQQLAQGQRLAQSQPMAQSGPLPQGRHFRPAATLQNSATAQTLEDMAYHRPAVMRHARDTDAEKPLRRVS
jgi:hypothetical protein